MTTPQPVDPLVEFTHKIRDEAAVVIERLHLKYLLVIFFAVAAIVFGAVKVHAWYEGRIAKLEAEKPMLQQKLDEATAARDVWIVQALALARTRATDTVHTNTVIRTTQTFTVPIPMPQPDGSVSEVPMPVVLKSDNDALRSACTRERHDCNAQIDALGKLIAEDTNRYNAMSDLYANSEHTNRLMKRADVVTKIEWGAGGAGVGMSVLAILYAVFHH